MFDHENNRPEALGTCVLVRIDGHSFVMTAAHTVRELKENRRRFAVAVGGKLLALFSDRFVTGPTDLADIGVIPLRSEVVEVFGAMGGQFIDTERFDEDEKGDGLDVVNTLTNTYFAIGYPASRSRSRVQHAQKKISATSYSVSLTLAPTSSYPDGLSPNQHLLLDYDERQIMLDGQPVNPPMVQGMSGGGVFRFQRRRPETVKLVGVLIEHHRKNRVIAATRIRVAADIAREVARNYPGVFV